MNIQTNFDMKLGCSIERTALGDLLHGSSTSWSCEVRDADCEVKQEEVNKTLSDTTEKRTIWVILNVKPNWEAVWVDP